MTKSNSLPSLEELAKQIWMLQDSDSIVDFSGELLRTLIASGAVMTGISVKDQLPKCDLECTSSHMQVSRSVVVFGTSMDGGPTVGLGHVQEDGQWVCYDAAYDFIHIKEVTHWLPIPSRQALDWSRELNAWHAQPFSSEKKASGLTEAERLARWAELCEKGHGATVALEIREVLAKG